MIRLTHEQFLMLTQGVNGLAFPNVNIRNIDAAVAFVKDQADLLELIKQMEKEQKESETKNDNPA
jgi:hypothetical protein